jgi:MFS transporter, DHA2 family, methylenomycin A resistance protein
VNPARVGALAALALVALDVGAVPAALPSARLDLGSSTSGVVWVQAAYLLALAVALALLGHAHAAPDRRVVAAAGLAVFACGALLASTADSTAALVAGRALQGAGAAGVLAPALGCLRPAGGERTRVLALVAAALLALAVAPLLGGALAEKADWRWLFRLELVGAAAAVLLALGAGGRDEASAGRPPDGARTAPLAAGLILATTGLIQSGPWGWASADTLVLLAAGAGLLVVAWRDGLAGADAAAFALAGCLGAALLLAPQYLELVRGLSPLRSGLLTLALTLPAAALAALGAALAGRLPGRLLVLGGVACAAVGALGMTRIDPATSYALVVLSLGLLGTGIGAAAGLLEATAATAAAAAAPGAALVVAAAGALMQEAQLDEREAGGTFEDALAAGVAASGWLLAALLAAAALLVLRSPR